MQLVHTWVVVVVVVVVVEGSVNEASSCIDYTCTPDKLSSKNPGYRLGQPNFSSDDYMHGKAGCMPLMTAESTMQSSCLFYSCLCVRSHTFGLCQLATHHKLCMMPLNTYDEICFPHTTTLKQCSKH